MYRGMINLSIEVLRKKDSETRVSYDVERFQSYYEQLKQLSDLVDADSEELFKMAVQSPDVSIPNPSRPWSDEEWQKVEKVLIEALNQCADFRQTEGEVLAQNLEQYLDRISTLLSQVEGYEPSRIEAIKARLNQSLNDLKVGHGVDQDRYEQELIFYLERLDITEEIDRLKSHLDYFKQTLDDGHSQGKKLGFISQEMGREINTIGSKANQSDIQKLVVEMKDELEKIKEQLFNIL